MQTHRKTNHINVIDREGVLCMRVSEVDGRKLLRAGMVIARGKRVVAALQLVAGATAAACHEELVARRRAGCADRLPVAEDNTTTWRDGRTISHRWLFAMVHPYA